MSENNIRTAIYKVCVALYRVDDIDKKRKDGSISEVSVHVNIRFGK